MSIRYSEKDFSQANVITTGTQVLVYGPVPVDWLDGFAINIINCSTLTINFTVRTSMDKARNFETLFPMGSFTNTQAFAVRSASTAIRHLHGHANPFKYISIYGSATSTVGTSNTLMKLTGRAMK